MGMDGLFEGLTKQKLAAFGCRDVTVSAECDVIGSQ